MIDSISMLADAQPDTWEACCRLYAADVAERALTLYGGKVDPRSSECVRVARLHAHGKATDEELKAARAGAWDDARADARDAEAADTGAWNAARYAAESAAWAATAWAAAWALEWGAGWSATAALATARATAHAAECAGVDRATERRAHRRRLLQYVEHGIEAENMPWT